MMIWECYNTSVQLYNPDLLPSKTFALLKFFNNKFQNT